jgi:hypothetical protein
MKQLFLLISLLFLSGPSRGQHFTLGIENGINYSNIHQSLGTNHIDGLPGPVNGFFVKYELANWLVLQSGINHTTNYFNQKDNYYYPDFYMTGNSSSFVQSTNYYNNQNFSFLRIPLLLKLKTGGRLSAEFGGGVYYAIVTNDEYRGKDKKMHSEEYNNENYPPLNDWGTILAGSLNFQIDRHWSLFAAGQITNAKTYFLKSIAGKIGSSEVTFGVGYSPFESKTFSNQTDSTPSGVVLLPHAGVLISMVHASDNNKNYMNKAGFSGGISIKYILNSHVSFNSGAWFERKGYSLDYAGIYDFIYLPAVENGSQTTSFLSSDVNLDYLTFPIVFEYATGNKFRSGFSFGCYFSWLQNAFSQGERTDSYYYDLGYNISTYYFENDLDKWFRNIDSGLMFGYRLEYSAFKRAGVFLGLNQTIGLVNLFENLNEIQSPPQSVSNLSLFNRSTTVMAGVNIPLSK